MANLRDVFQAGSTQPAAPIIEGLWSEGENLLIHALPEQYKTFLMLTLAEAIARGGECLGFSVPEPHSVFLVETDMGMAPFRQRLDAMNQARELPWDRLKAPTEAQLKDFSRTPSLTGKFGLIERWLNESPADVVFLDSTNQFFRGIANPNDERFVGEFFDALEKLPCKARAFLRHEAKLPHVAGVQAEPSLQRVRGSGVWGDAVDLAIAPHRVDRRTQEVALYITKARNRVVSTPLTAWLDKTALRLVAGAPLEAVRAAHRGETLDQMAVLRELYERFGIGDRRGREMLTASGWAAGWVGHRRSITLPVVPVSTFETGSEPSETVQQEA